MVSLSAADTQPWLSPRDALVAILPGLLIVIYVGWLLTWIPGGAGLLTRVLTVQGALHQVLTAVGLVAGFGVLCLMLAQASRFSVHFLARGIPIAGLRRWLAARELTRKDRYEYGRRFADFPEDEQAIQPSRLGNILAAAEDYAADPMRYGITMNLFWPHLWAVADDALRAQLAAARSGLELRAVLSVAAAIAGVVTLVLTPWLKIGPVTAVVAALILLIISRALYLLALSPARAYAALLRCTVDLNRRSVLASLGVDPPSTLTEERQTWAALAQFVYRRGVSEDAKVPYLAETMPDTDAGHVAK